MKKLGISAFLIGMLVTQQTTICADTAIIFTDDNTADPSVYDQTLGWQFTVNTDITITKLGNYDPSGSLADPHPIGIWNSSGQLILQATIPHMGGTREGNFRYVDVPSQTLTPGQYVIGALYYANHPDLVNGADCCLSVNPHLTSVHGRYVHGPTLALPLNSAGPNIVAYFGPNFQFTPADDCSISVTRLSQGDTNWASNLYDHSSKKTIQNKGCALTALCMALNYAGVNSWLVQDPNGNQYAVPNDPGTLNLLMTFGDYQGNGGYSGMSVDWGPATKIAANQAGLTNIQFHHKKIASATQPVNALASAYLEEVICNRGFPVVAAVNNASHFVLITGKEGDRFTIADPGYSGRVYLDAAPYVSFETRGYVADLDEDISELSISCPLFLSGVAFTVTDSEGRTTGSLISPGAQLEGIPNSVCFVDAIDDDVTGESATDANEYVHIFQPGSGPYVVNVASVAAAQFNLRVNTVAHDGTLQPRVEIAGIVSGGSPVSYELVLDSMPGARADVIQLVTFESLLLEIEASADLGLIYSPFVARSLSAKVLAARRAADRGTEAVATLILRAFIRQLHGLEGRHLDPAAVAILAESAEALLAAYESAVDER